MNDAEKQLDDLVHRLRDKWQHSEEDCYAAATVIERLRIENRMLLDALKIVNDINERQHGEINKLRRENDAFTEIAFDLACVDENHRTEHDDLLIEDAFRRAKEWYKENKE